jgi:hypothetical protein
VRREGVLGDGVFEGVQDMNDNEIFEGLSMGKRKEIGYGLHGAAEHLQLIQWLFGERVGTEEGRKSTVKELDAVVEKIKAVKHIVESCN